MKFLEFIKHSIYPSSRLFFQQCVPSSQAQQRYTYTENGYEEVGQETLETYDSEVSVYSTAATAARSPKSKKPGLHGITTTHLFHNRIRRSPKEKFLCLVKKLSRIANAIDNQKDLNKLSAALVDVIIQAKPMIAEDKLDVLYEVEPRALIHPRRNRPYRPKVRLLSSRRKYASFDSCGHLEFLCPISTTPYRLTAPPPPSFSLLPLRLSSTLTAPFLLFTASSYVFSSLSLMPYTVYSYLLQGTFSSPNSYM